MNYHDLISICTPIASIVFAFAVVKSKVKFLEERRIEDNKSHKEKQREMDSKIEKNSDSIKENTYLINEQSKQFMQSLNDIKDLLHESQIKIIKFNSTIISCLPFKWGIKAF